MEDREDVSDVCAAAAARFPAVFGDAGRRPPLKVGVRKDVILGLSDFSQESVERFLLAWTSSHEYRTSLAAGGPRYDLSGEVCGEVSPSESTCWIGQVAQRLYRQMRHGEALAARAVMTDPRNAGMMPAVIAAAREINRRRMGKRAYRFWPDRPQDGAKG